MFRKKLNISKIVNKKNLMLRLTVFFLAVFIGALNFNLFLVPNNIVVGGISGLAIIFQDLFVISIPLFLNICMVILFFMSLILLDIKTTFLTLFGSFTWNMMVMITAPIASFLSVSFDSTFMMLLIVAIVNGIAFGLVYRTGFNTGGADVILLIMKKYLKMPMGLAGIWFNIFIVTFGFIIFGATRTVFAVFILILSNWITDWVTLGVKDSKMCFVKSDLSDEIEDYLINKGRMGVTKIQSKGGIFTKKEAMLLVIVSIDDYYGFKHLIKRFDEEAFTMATDCYTVIGGYKKHIIPF